MSNFLGEPAASRRSMIISHAEVLVREQQGIQKNMNFRDDGRPSVFLISDRGEEHTDVWHEEEQVLVVEGHDASVKGTKKKVSDQEAVHESGLLTDNGKFYREANKFKDGVRKDPMQIQVYEWLEAGVWYDKGIFSLVDAQRHMKDKRRIFTFVLSPSFCGADELYKRERVIPAAIKQQVWVRDHGRCVICGSQSHLFFETMQPERDGGTGNDAENVSLRCAAHASGARTGFL